MSHSPLGRSARACVLLIPLTDGSCHTGHRHHTDASKSGSEGRHLQGLIRRNGVQTGRTLCSWESRPLLGCLLVDGQAVAVSKGGRVGHRSDYFRALSLHLILEINRSHLLPPLLHSSLPLPLPTLVLHTCKPFILANPRSYPYYRNTLHPYAQKTGPSSSLEADSPRPP